MTIHLPKGIEKSIKEAVLSGRFASLDDAMTEAARLLLQERNQGQPPEPNVANGSPDPLLGSMSGHTELIDEIVEEAMRNREQQPWRVAASESPSIKDSSW
jgi:Arc/MetJ-type ribon-helix-helix transcriptional regulator